MLTELIDYYDVDIFSHMIYPTIYIYKRVCRTWYEIISEDNSLNPYIEYNNRKICYLKDIIHTLEYYFGGNLIEHYVVHYDEIPTNLYRSRRWYTKKASIIDEEFIIPEIKYNSKNGEWNLILLKDEPYKENIHCGFAHENNRLIYLKGRMNIIFPNSDIKIRLYNYRDFYTGKISVAYKRLIRLLNNSKRSKESILCKNIPTKIDKRYFIKHFNTNKNRNNLIIHNLEIYG